MIKFKELDPELKKELHVWLVANCLDGECYAFAIAMHKCLGWPIISLMQDKTIRHAAVIDSNGNIWDCRGIVTKEEFGKPFGNQTTHILKTLTAQELNLKTPISEILVDSISRRIQLVWPNLPWKSNTLAVRTKAFSEELEQLSRKHGLWIYGNFLATLPAIAEGDGEESGYSLECTMGNYMINRLF